MYTLNQQKKEGGGRECKHVLSVETVYTIWLVRADTWLVIVLVIKIPQLFLFNLYIFYLWVHTSHNLCIELMEVDPLFLTSRLGFLLEYVIIIHHELCIHNCKSNCTSFMFLYKNFLLYSVSPVKCLSLRQNMYVIQ